MLNRIFITVFIIICWFNLPANQLLHIDSVKYSFESDYAAANPFEVVTHFDSLLHTDSLSNYETVWILFNKGAILSSFYEPESALECFNKLQDVNVHALIDNSIVYEQIGYTYENLYHYTEAEKYFHMALNESSISDTIALGSLFNSIGRVNYSAGIYEKAIKYLLKANSLARKIDDTTTFLSSSVNLGTVYSQWGQNEKAIKVFNDALNFIGKKGFDSYRGMLLSNLGVSYFYLKEYHLALSFYERALKIELKNGDNFDISGSYHNIGNVYEVMGEYNEALEFYLKALNIQNSISDYDGLVLTSHDIGLVYSYLGDMDLAFDNVYKSLRIAKSKGFVRNEMTAYKTLAELYAKVDSFNVAYNYQLHYNELKDSLFSSDKNIEIAKQQARFDSEQQKVKIELLSKEKEIINTKIEHHKIVITSFIVLTILMLAALIVGFRLLAIKRKANEKLKEQEKQIVEITQKVLKQNDSLIDNLEYGKVIQKAVLAGKTNLDNWFSEMYFFNQPQLIVSGDFFWSKSIENKLYVVMADCTGHGVPGGFMSMLGVAFLNDLTTDEFKYYPDELLNKLRERVKYALNQSDFGTQTHDGMDLACCLFDFDKGILYFSGAHMPVWHQNMKELIRYKGDLFPIGVCVKEKPFSLTEIEFKKGDSFYLFTDGIIDQFDKDGKRYSNNRLANILNETKDSSFVDQKQILQNQLLLWKGEAQQTDDSLFLGLKV